MRFFPQYSFSLLLFGVLTGVFLMSCSHPSLNASTTPPGTLQLPPLKGYVVQNGDILSVDFSHHPRYSKKTVVRSDGRITLPLLGEVQGAGLTPSTLTRSLKSRYQSHLRYPDLTVTLESSPSQVVYVGGEVRNPGLYPLTGGKTALQAFLEAGGATTNANLRKVFLLRNTGAPRPHLIALNLRGAVTGKSAPLKHQLQPKDMLVVSKTGIASANEFVDQYFNKLIPFSKSLGVSYFIGNGVE